MQLHWAASLHPIWSSYAKETRQKQHLPVLSTRGVPPSTVFRAPKNSHVADVARLPFGQFVYSTHANDDDGLPSSMLTCSKNNIRFSLRFKENQAAQRVRNCMFFGPPKTAMWPMLQHLLLKHSVDSTHENDHERLPSSMLTCPKNNIRFSFRFKEKRAARRVRKACFFLPQQSCDFVPCVQLRRNIKTRFFLL